MRLATLVVEWSLRGGPRPTPRDFQSTAMTFAPVTFAPALPTSLRVAAYPPAAGALVPSGIITPELQT